MKYLITALFAAVFAFGAVAAEDAPWQETLGRVTDLTADTGISGFMKNEAPAYITGNFSEAERPDLKKGERANRNGYYDKDGNLIEKIDEFNSLYDLHDYEIKWPEGVTPPGEEETGGDSGSGDSGSGETGGGGSGSGDSGGDTGSGDEVIIVG